jgi:hypothetical protein
MHRMPLEPDHIPSPPRIGRGDLQLLCVWQFEELGENEVTIHPTDVKGMSRIHQKAPGRQLLSTARLYGKHIYHVAIGLLIPDRRQEASIAIQAERLISNTSNNQRKLRLCTPPLFISYITSGE